MVALAEGVLEISKKKKEEERFRHLGMLSISLPFSDIQIQYALMCLIGFRDVVKIQHYTLYRAHMYEILYILFVGIR